MNHNACAQITACFSLLLTLWLGTPQVSGLTMSDLRQIPKLTPQRFAKCFSNFAFEFHAEVQEPETFLARGAGDCDDYAVVADRILREKGYTTRLITIRMPSQIHVVCYVVETHCYLDYNSRGCLIRTTSCNNSMDEIARKVARTFGENWTSVSEFAFQDGHKRLMSTQLPGGIPVGEQNLLAGQPINQKTAN
jgi:hypothetical protein